MTFTEAAAALEKAMKDLEAKRIAATNANAIATSANESYQKSLDAAKSARNLLDDTLTEVFPKEYKAKIA